MMMVSKLEKTDGPYKGLPSIFKAEYLTDGNRWVDLVLSCPALDLQYKKGGEGRTLEGFDKSRL